MEIGIISTDLMITVFCSCTLNCDKLFISQVWLTDSLSHEHLWCNQMLCGWTELQWSKFNYCESIHMYKSSREHFKWGLLVQLLLLLISTTSGSFNSKEFPELKPAFTRPATLDLQEWKSTKTLVWESVCVRYPIFLNCWWSPKKFPICLQSTITLLLSQFSCLQKYTRLQPILYFQKINSHFKGKKVKICWWNHKLFLKNYAIRFDFSPITWKYKFKIWHHCPGRTHHNSNDGRLNDKTLHSVFDIVNYWYRWL